MGRGPKILESARNNPVGLSFADLQYLVVAAGFRLKRTRGDHHIYTREDLVEILNLQPRGKEANPTRCARWWK